LITGGHKSQQSGQNRARDADGSGSKTKTIKYDNGNAEIRSERIGVESSLTGR